MNSNSKKDEMAGGSARLPALVAAACGLLLWSCAVSLANADATLNFASYGCNINSGNLLAMRPQMHFGCLATDVWRNKNYQELRSVAKQKDFILEHLQEFGIFYSQNMEFANSQISIGRKKEVISNSLL